MGGGMAERFDSAVTFDYKLDEKYSTLLSERELVRGSAFSFSINIVNKSAKITPPITIVMQTVEQGVVWTYPQNIEIPSLEPGASFRSIEYSFTPWVEGICKMVLIAQELNENEIWFTAPFAGTARRQSENLFRVVNRQDLEIIGLLKEILRKEKK
jgi:hypothetical protein